MEGSSSLPVFAGRVVPAMYLRYGSSSAWIWHGGAGSPSRARQVQRTPMRCEQAACPT